jgi:hypothetical protein
VISLAEARHDSNDKYPTFPAIQASAASGSVAGYFRLFPDDALPGGRPLRQDPVALNF